MRRFIRYLYEYEQEKKMRNVGFVKIEQDMEQCVIHVHGKGFRMEEDAKGLEVYLFWNQDEKCTGINMGVTEPPSPGLNYQLCYTPEDMGEKENYGLVNGIILKDISGHCYAAVWNDDAVNICQMEKWEMAEEETHEKEKSNAEASEEQEVKECGKRYKVRKIQRKDMVCLPRCEWKHANNSFLVHGYYNYHNVMILPENEVITNFERMRIGIQVDDLYYLLRKVMEKYHWKQKTGQNILEAYESVRQLKPDEREYLCLRLAYPEKFWKTASAYSRSNKAWLPEKSVEKLQTAVEQTKEKEVFLREVFE